MNRFFVLLFTIGLFLLPLPTMAVSQQEAVITLTLPQSVIATTVEKFLPLEIDPASKTLKGTITIISIEDLQLKPGFLFCKLNLAGNDLQLAAQLAGQEFRIKVGSINLDLNCKAKIRFDQAKQTLYITPLVDDVQSSTSPKAGDIGRTLMALLNGREFPVTMQDLEPMIAKTANKTVTIDMNIADIAVIENALQLSIAPEIH